MPDIPDVDDTDLAREEMEEVAEDVGIDPAGLDDQQLLEQLGVALGEIDESHVDEGDEGDATGRDGDPTEQSMPGEPIEGPTRNELRDELRELGQPVTGTKDELQQRLDEARGDENPEGDEDGDGQDEDEDEDEDDEDDDGIGGTRRERLRQKVSQLLARTSDRVAVENGPDGGDGRDVSDEDSGENEERRRDRVADRLEAVADRIRETGQDDDSGSS